MNLKTFVEVSKLLLLPVISILYISFCWAARSSLVLVPGYVPLRILQPALTTVNILVIFLATVPMRGLIADLKGEEFIRLLRNSNSEKHHSPGGVSFALANSVSSSSLGMLGSVPMVLKRKCSLHFSVGIVSSFIVMAISALAPATLFIKLVDLPNELGTFYVGSMYLDSVAAIDSSIPDFHPTYQRYKFNDNMTNPSSSGSELLDSFLRSDLRATFLRYVVPLPRTSPRVVSARWWTDAFALNPICSWLPNVTEPSGLEHLPDGTIDFHLRSRAISFNLNPSRPFYNESYLFDMQCVSESLDRRSTIWNTTTDDVPSGGWSVWAMTIQSSSRAFDMALWLPTFSTDSLRFAILMCTPGFSIEPVEVAIEESVLSISPTWPDNRGWNLDQRQAEFFFSTLLCNDSSFSETVLPLVQEGNIFDLSSAYATALQNTAQSYMSCALGEADTLFRRSIPTFTAPLGYVIASTALFVVLNAINIWAYFRSGKGEVFSLFAIAGLLHDSNVAEEVDRFRQENTERSVEDMQNKFEKELKNRFITLDHRDDAGESEVLVLHDADNHP